MGIFARINERMDRQAHLMGEMMKRLDVNTEAAADGLESAARRCLMCRAGEECQHWLEGKGDTAPDFCPNADLFALYSK